MTATPRNGFVAAAVLLFTASAAPGETVTLIPVANASVDYLFGDANLGSLSTLEIGYLLRSPESFSSRANRSFSFLQRTHRCRARRLVDGDWHARCFPPRGTGASP